MEITNNMDLNHSRDRKLGQIFTAEVAKFVLSRSGHDECVHLSSSVRERITNGNPTLPAVEFLALVIKDQVATNQKDTVGIDLPQSPYISGGKKPDYIIYCNPTEKYIDKETNRSVRDWEHRVRGHDTNYPESARITLVQHLPPASRFEDANDGRSWGNGPFNYGESGDTYSSFYRVGISEEGNLTFDQMSIGQDNKWIKVT